MKEGTNTKYYDSTVITKAQDMEVCLLTLDRRFSNFFSQVFTFALVIGKTYPGVDVPVYGQSNAGA